MSLGEPILTISVTANLLGIHPRTLMLYEKMGFFLPHRTQTQRRMFSLKNLEELQFIKFLTQEKGVNLYGVKLLLEAIGLAKREGVDLKTLLFPSFKSKRLI